MERRSDDRDFTLAEVLIAMAILAIGLVALMATLSRGTLNVSVGGGQTKANEYARQQVERLRNQPLCPAAGPLPANCFPTNSPPNGADTPETGVARNWTITPVGPTVAPNRLWSIRVTVTVNQSSRVAGAQSIILRTMRAE